MIKKSIFIVLSLVVTSWTLRAAAVSKIPARVAFIGPFSKSDYSKKIEPFYKQVARCEKCEISNLTPYKGPAEEIDYDQFWTTVINLPTEYSIVYLHWNEPIDSKNKGFVNQISQRLNNDLVLVGYVGEPRPTGRQTSLNKTVLGQVRQAIMIGELAERERLLPQLFYGPEMLTALKPPTEYLEQGFAPLLFVSELSQQFWQRKAQDWPDHLRRKKAKNKKLWPAVSDLF